MDANAELPRLGEVDDDDGPIGIFHLVFVL